MADAVAIDIDICRPFGYAIADIDADYFFLRYAAATIYFFDTLDTSWWFHYWYAI